MMSKSLSFEEMKTLFMPPKYKQMSTSSYVCFPCRKHRSIDRYPSYPKTYPETVPCPICNLAMYHVGHKLEIPPQSDVHAWKLFYDQLTAPGYGSCAALDAERDHENAHWVVCKLRSGGKPCDRCKEVAKRLPTHGLGSRWNDVVR